MDGTNSVLANYDILYVLIGSIGTLCSYYLAPWLLCATMPEKKKLCHKASSHVRSTVHKDTERLAHGAKSKHSRHTTGVGTGGKGMRQAKSAVATPYNLIPGGGERYLLSMAKAMQLMGEHVDIIVYPGNSCATVQCVKGTAEAVRVGIGMIKAATSAQ